MRVIRGVEIARQRPSPVSDDEGEHCWELNQEKRKELIRR